MVEVVTPSGGGCNPTYEIRAYVLLTRYLLLTTYHIEVWVYILYDEGDVFFDR